MTNLTKLSRIEAEKDVNGLVLNFNHVPFKKDIFLGVQVIEVFTDKNIYKVVEVFESGLSAVKLTAKGEIDGRVNETFFWFSHVTAIYVDGELTTHVEISELETAEKDESNAPHNAIVTANNVEYLSGVPSNTFDLTVTSPPYDDIRDYNGYSIDYKALAEELYRTTKEGGVVVWVVGDAVKNGSESGNSFRQALMFMDAGFKLHDTMIYEKNTSSFPARANSNRYTQIFEYMFVFAKGKIKTANLICDKENKYAGHTNWGANTQRGKDGVLKESKKIKPVPTHSPRNNIWKYTVGGGFASKDKLAHKHPAIFPEKLAEDHILTWSNPGDLVLDCFGGSGTTAKMSKLNGRNFVYIDISEEYAELARERLSFIV